MLALNLISFISYLLDERASLLSFLYFIYSRELISSYPKPSYYLAAPTIRTRPSWYLNLLPDVTQMLTRSLIHHSPNLLSLKAFQCTAKDLDSDGVHFSTLTGLSYVNHLLEQPRYFANHYLLFVKYYPMFSIEGKITLSYV